MTFTRRRWRNIAITFVAAALLAGAHTVYDIALYDSAFLSGWLLLASVLFLTLYNARKKISMLPIGANPIWLQLHIYVGLLGILLFFIHVDWSVPDGWFEGIFALVFVLVAGSGVLGLFFSRSFPKRLTRRGEEVIFERIPVFIARLRNEAEQVVLDATRETNSSTIRDFYIEQLAPFFAGTRNFLPHLFASNRALFTLLAELDDHGRYLSAKEVEFADHLRRLVNKKDELDFHYALQGTLKFWLFVHVPLTYSLLIMAALHLVFTFAFSGGIG